MATIDDRKKRIMEHLSRSTADFAKSSPQNSDQRRQRISDHIRLTRG